MFHKMLLAVALLSGTAEANACVLGLRKTGEQQLFVIMRFGTFTDGSYLRILARKNNPSCTATIGSVERVDHTTYLVQYIGNESCGEPNPRMYQYQCIEPDTL
jgi:hypothetical protein